MPPVPSSGSSVTAAAERAPGYRFGNAVRVIRSPVDDRFVLLNLHHRIQPGYIVLDRNAAALLHLFEGRTAPELHAESTLPAEQVDGLLGDLRAAGFFRDHAPPPAVEVSPPGAPVPGPSGAGPEEDLKDFLELAPAGARWPAYCRALGPTPGPSITLNLHLTNLCNMRCVYCYHFDNLRRNDSLLPTMTMSEATAKAAVQMAFDAADLRQDAPSIEVAFWGGQPSLLGPIRRVLKSALEEGDRLGRERRRYVRFSVVDNGTRLDPEYLRLLQDYGLSASLSFDLPKDVHERHRPMRSGGPSSHLLEAYALELRRAGIPLALRSTLTDLNVDRMVEIIDYAHHTLGIDSLAMMPLEDTGTLPGISPPEGNTLIRRYLEALDYCIDRFQRDQVFISFHPVAMLLQAIVAGGIPVACGVGRTSFSVDTDGRVYSCHRARVDAFCHGSVQDRDIAQRFVRSPQSLKARVLTDFFAPPATTCAGGGRCHCGSQPGHNCRECDVLPFCLGGCPAVSLVNHGCNNFGTSLLRDGGTPGEKCAFFRDLVRQLLFLYLGAVETKDPRVLGYCSRLGYHDGLVC